MKNNLKPNLIKPRWRKVLTDLWEDKTRTGLVVASIAAGVFAIGMIISAFSILSEDVNHSYASVNPPNIEISTDPFDDELVKVIGKVDGVGDVEGRRIIEVRARKGTEGWQGLKLIGVADTPGVINLLDPIEGVRFPDKDQAVITQNMMSATGFHTGDVIEIKLPDGSIHEVTVAGLVTDQTTAKPNPNAKSNAYITLKTLESFGLDRSFNHLYVTVDGDGGDSEFIAGVARVVENKVEKSGREVYRTDESLSNEHPMIDSILAILGVLGALGVLVTVLSSSLIINTLNALLTRQMRQIGIMKLVGGRTYQIMSMYLTLIIVYSLIAVGIAVPLGALAGYGLALGVAGMTGAVLQGFRVIPAAVITQIIIAIIIPLCAGFFPVNSGVKTKVQQAISNNQSNTGTAKNSLFRLNAKWFARISRPIVLSFRNTFRKRGRLLLTIFTLTVAGAVFIAVFNVRDSMGSMITNLRQHFMSDVSINFRRPYRIDKVEQVLLGIPGVKSVEAWGGTSGEIWDEKDNLVSKISISAPPNDTQLLDPEFVAGRWLLPNEEKALVVSDNIYDLYPDLKPGDKLIIKLPEQREEAWTVVGIFKYVSILGDPMAYADFGYIAQKTHLYNQATSFSVIADSHDGKFQKELAQGIDRHLTDRDFSIQSVQAGSTVQENATLGIDVLVIFLLIMAILTAFVGSIGLTGTMSINVLERTREIGVMRTIGAVDRVVMQSIIIEGLFIGLITWVLAVGVSFPISSMLLTIIGQTMAGSAIALSYTPMGILLWLGVVILLSIFASIAPARSAARLTINEVLAYE